MKKLLWFVAVLVFVVTCFVVADDVAQSVAEEVDASVVAETGESALETPAEEAVESTKSDSKGISMSQRVWTFLNSSLGVSVVVFVLSFILGKIFTAKPKWKALMLKYGPSLMQAVKTAEKNISGDTGNKGLARLDAALLYLIELEPKLKKVADNDLKQALSAVHSAAESHGNLKKG